jgi:hypothetical protein
VAVNQYQQDDNLKLKVEELSGECQIQRETIDKLKGDLADKESFIEEMEKEKQRLKFDIEVHKGRAER